MRAKQHQKRLVVSAVMPKLIIEKQYKKDYDYPHDTSYQNLSYFFETMPPENSVVVATHQVKQYPEQWHKNQTQVVILVELNAQWETRQFRIHYSLPEYK